MVSQETGPDVGTDQPAAESRQPVTFDPHYIASIIPHLRQAADRLPNSPSAEESEVNNLLRRSLTELFERSRLALIASGNEDLAAQAAATNLKVNKVQGSKAILPFRSGPPPRLYPGDTPPRL